MSFASPGYLALLALAPLLAAAYLALARWRRRAAERFAPGRDALDLSPAASPGRRTLKAALVVLAVAVLAVALARPRLGQQEMVIYQTGADVVIVLDVSRSMLADDVTPSRLALAQQETLALLDRLRGHRVGLVIFARSALLRSPLTTDKAPVRALVQSAQQDSALLRPGSNVGAAVRAAALALEAGEGESEAIVLVTDGEDHEGDALAAAQDLGREGILLYTAGVGTERGAPVPVIDPETGLPIAGEGTGEGASIVTSLNEELLRRMAAATPQGVYRPGEELAELAEVLDRLERTPFAAERQRQPIERFQWVVLAALALLALDALLPERRGAGWPRLRLPQGAAARAARGPAVLILLALVAASCGSTAAGLIAEGNRALDQGNDREALEAYRRAAAVAPDRPEPHLNAGLVLHRLERYEEAAAETVRALPIDDPLQAARAHYNLGNHYAQMGRLADARDSYREALLLEPNDEDAKHNLELVLQLLQIIQVTRIEDPSEPGSGGGEGDPADGESSSDEGAPADGEEGGDPANRAAATRRALDELLEGIDEEFTVEEALRVLELTQELNRRRPVAEPGSASGEADHPDY
jgi:Ca-activated chloride channel family protein